MIAFCLFLFIDLFIYLTAIHSLYAIRQPQDGELEFRSPYTYLEDLYSTGLINASKYPPIVSLPRISVQVSAVDKTRVFPQDNHRWLSQYGTVSPPDRHVLLTNAVRGPVPLHFMHSSYICGRLIPSCNFGQWTSGWNAVSLRCAFRHQIWIRQWLSAMDLSSYASST